MKYLVFLLFILAACDSDFTFKNPMPPDLVAIDVIPDHYIGRYKCISDSSIVNIYSTIITIESSSVFVSRLDSVEEKENCSIIDGGLYIPGRKECIPFEYINEDSIRAILWDLDTLIDLSSDHDVLKLYNNVLYVNKSNEQNLWMCWAVETIDNGSLRASVIDIPSTKDSIEKITLSFDSVIGNNNKLKYIVDPDINEFDSLIKMGLNSGIEIFEPINLEIIPIDNSKGKGG